MKPCGVCGCDDRNAGGKCRPCQAARSARWSAANAEKEKAMKAAAYRANAESVKRRSAAWYAANKERASLTAAARYAANPEAKKESVRAWERSNPERVRQLNKAWFAANREKAHASAARWRAANPEKRRQIAAAYRANNPGYSRRKSADRRARKRANGGVLSRGLTEKLLRLQRGKCACCGKPLGRNYHLDHVLPLARGGINADSNMQLLRKLCNLRKSAKHPVDYMQSLGKLL